VSDFTTVTRPTGVIPFAITLPHFIRKERRGKRKREGERKVSSSSFAAPWLAASIMHLFEKEGKGKKRGKGGSRGRISRHERKKKKEEKRNSHLPKSSYFRPSQQV